MQSAVGVRSKTINFTLLEELFRRSAFQKAQWFLLTLGPVELKDTLSFLECLCQLCDISVCERPSSHCTLERPNSKVSDRPTSRNTIERPSSKVSDRPSSHSSTRPSTTSNSKRQTEIIIFDKPEALLSTDPYLQNNPTEVLCEHYCHALFKDEYVEQACDFVNSLNETKTDAMNVLKKLFCSLDVSIVTEIERPKTMHCRPLPFNRQLQIEFEQFREKERLRPRSTSANTQLFGVSTNTQAYRRPTSAVVNLAASSAKEAQTRNKSMQNSQSLAMRDCRVCINPFISTAKESNIKQMNAQRRFPKSDFVSTQYNKNQNNATNNPIPSGLTPLNDDDDPLWRAFLNKQ